jgi:hypothetical protein
MASRKLKVPTKQVVPNAAFCSAFEQDFLNGRNVRAIEPDYAVLLVDDPRLEPWMSTKDCPESDNLDPYSRWLGLGLYGVPPYRFYHLELDGDKKDGLENVVLYREAGNGYGQRYEWVDLRACAIRVAQHVMSPQESGASYQDAIGLLIAYRGQVMKLEYINWAKRGAVETNGGRISLSAFVQSGACSWSEPLKSVN